jgi:hypothetical protein
MTPVLSLMSPGFGRRSRRARVKPVRVQPRTPLLPLRRLVAAKPVAPAVVPDEGQSIGGLQTANDDDLSLETVGDTRVRRRVPKAQLGKLFLDIPPDSAVLIGRVGLWHPGLKLLQNLRARIGQGLFERLGQLVAEKKLFMLGLPEKMWAFEGEGKDRGHVTSGIHTLVSPTAGLLTSDASAHIRYRSTLDLPKSWHVMALGKNETVINSLDGTELVSLPPPSLVDGKPLLNAYAIPGPVTLKLPKAPAIVPLPEQAEQSGPAEPGEHTPSS